MNAISRYFQTIFTAEQRRSRLFWARFGLGCVLVLLVILQLFHFERFPDALRQLSFVVDDVFAQVFAIGIVALEIMAIPYLLGLKLSSRMLVWSKYIGLVVFLIWFICMTWGLGQAIQPDTAVMVGDAVQVSFGFWVVLFAGVLLVLDVLIVFYRQLHQLLEKSR